MEIERIDLEGLVSSQILDYKKFDKSHKFRCKCPHCPPEKSPAMSVLGNLKVGICFRCEILFVSDDTKAKLKSEDIAISLEETKKRKDKLIVLNETIFDLYEDANNNEFLNNRNPYVKDWSVYGIKQGDNEVITPYRMFGELVFFQIRRYNPRGFYNPKDIDAPLFIPRERWYQDVPTIDCEGPFDAIALDCVRQNLKMTFNICALGGKVITSYRLTLLKLLGVSSMLVCLDETELSVAFKESVKGEFYPVVPIKADGRDPEEMLVQFGIDKYSEYIKNYLNYVSKTLWKTPKTFRVSKLEEDKLSFGDGGSK